MKKKLLTLLLSIAVILTSTVTVFAINITNSGDIFNTVNDVNRWTNEHGKVFANLYDYNDELLNQEVKTEDGVIYTFSYDNVDYALMIMNDKLFSIEVRKCTVDDYNGIYTAPTIAQVLATVKESVFPTSISTAWTNNDGKARMLYVNNDKLTIGKIDTGNFVDEYEYSVNSTIEVEEDQYIFKTENHGTIKFNMDSNDTLISITLESSSDDYEGTYAPLSIGDILPEGFPTSDEDHSWYNSENENVYIYKDETNSKLVFAETSFTEGVSTLGALSRTDKDQTWSDTTTCRLVYSTDDIVIQFNMTGDNCDKLENIVVTRCTYDALCMGTYYPPEPITISTIADVLATNTNFPKSIDSAWLKADGKKSYILNGNSLVYGDSSIELSKEVTKKDDGNYEYKGTSTTFTFIMNSNVLTEINVTGSSTSTNNGTYAKPVTVTFDMKGHGTQVSSQFIPNGTTATKPTDPVDLINGYIFEGWYKEATCNNVFDFETNITSDLTLYAKWRAPKFADILPEDFPNTKEEAWINELGSKLYLSNGSLYTNDSNFANITLDTTIYLGLDSKKYYWSGTTGGVTLRIDFNTDGTGSTNISSIKISREPAQSNIIFGTYAKPVTMKISDILTKSENTFPTSKESGWKNSTDSALYISGSNLKFGGFTKNNALSLDATKVGDNYVYSDQYAKITFFVKNENLVKVKLEASTSYDGEYLPTPSAPEAGEGYTIDYINEKITIENGYEISKANNPFKAETLTDNKTDAIPNTTYYIRKKAVTDVSAASNSIAFTTPDRPAAVTGVEAHQETYMNREDASLHGVDETMEYRTSFNKEEYSSWLNGSGYSIGFVFDITPTPATSYDIKVRYKATDNSFAGEETTYSFVPSDNKITVTLDEIEQQVPYNGKLEKPNDPTKEGYVFGGWYLEEDCINAWNFEIDTIFDGLDGYPDEIKLYPKWIKKSDNPISTSEATISGSNGDNEIAKVELYKGRELVVSTQTDNSGNYKLGNILPGDYNLVITKDNKITTTLLHIEDSSVPTVTIPNKDVNSVIERSFSVDGTKSDVSQVLVGGLDEIAKNKDPQTGQSITIKLHVEGKEDFEIDNAESIKSEAGSVKHIEFFDFRLLENESSIGDTNTQLLTIVMPFDFTNVDVNSVMILRHHGSSEKLTKNPENGQEGYKIDKEAGTITIYAKKFSSYAVAYNNVNDSPTPNPDTKPRYKVPNTGVEGTYSNNHSLLKLSSLSLLAIGTYLVIKKKKDN